MSMMLSRWATSLAVLAAIFSVESAFNNEETVDASNHNTQNVGTVLFHGGDMHRNCWEDCSYLLLQARWIAQTLIPRGKVFIGNEAYIDAFISYVESTLQTTRGMSKGLAQQMMVDVLADVHGGYLRATLLPLTREAFYAGSVRYDEADKLFKLYEELKSLLSTDGTGWQHTLPSNLRQRLSVRRLNLDSPSKQRCETACEDFIPYEKCRETKPRNDSGRSTTCGTCVNPCNAARQAHLKNNKTCRPDEKCCASMGVLIPIPFLDDNHHPHSIAVPLRPLSLHSLFAAKSQSLVTKYYKSAMRCLLARNSTKSEILEYNRQFRRWLVSAVLPHLNEETFYPAFGSVMRVVETMRAMGFERVNQELLIPMNEPRKVNSLRTLLKSARLEGQGSWKAFKTVKQTSRHRKVKTTPSNSDDDEELPLRRSTTDIDDEFTEQSSSNPRGRFHTTESGISGEAHEIQTVYSDFESRASDIGGKRNEVTNKLPRGTMDVLLCIILGMLGTLLLWMMCACCYCLITRLRGKDGSKGGACYPKGDRCESKPYYGTTDNRGASMPHLQPVSYEYSSYDTRPMRPLLVSGQPQYAGTWNQPMYASDPHQPMYASDPHQHSSACRVIMMPPYQEPPQREMREPPRERQRETVPEPEPPPPLPPPPPREPEPTYREPSMVAPPPEPPVRESFSHYPSPSFRGHEAPSLTDMDDMSQSIRRPPSIRQEPQPQPVEHKPKMDYRKRTSPGKSLGMIESMQSITSPKDSGQYLVPPKRMGDSEVSIPPSLLAGDDSTRMSRQPWQNASTQSRQSSIYRGRRKTMPQQVKAPRLTNMPLGSW